MAKQRAARWRTAVNVDLMQSRMRGRRERRRGRREGWREGVITSRTWRQCTTACPAPTTSSGTSVGEWNNNRLRRYQFLTPEIRTPNLLLDYYTSVISSGRWGGEVVKWRGDVWPQGGEGGEKTISKVLDNGSQRSLASPPLILLGLRERERKEDTSKWQGNFFGKCTS